MLDFLSPAGIDGLARIAWQITLVSALSTLVLFVYTMGLRAATVLQARHDAAVERRWRGLLISVAASDDELPPVPRIRHREATAVLELWNTIRGLVDGPAAGRLIALARIVGLEAIAVRKLARRNLRSQLLGAQTLGFLGSDTRFGELRQMLDDRNTALSVTAATALARIDPARALPEIIKRVAERRDWPRNNVSQILCLLGNERLSRPFSALVIAADDGARAYLLQFAALLAPDVYDELATELLRESTDPRVLAASMKLISGRLGAPRLPWLAAHDVPFVRIQTARTLGRIGDREHVPLLTRLLSDREWWVRYRAAQALVRLPFLGPNALRKLQSTQQDRFAADMLQQAMAEARLA